ncbi:sugar transferase [Promicromonospora citrea]|uniref:Polyprenyl glycosylphosphotransferase n=1 Tax=Promicromonospora citrea TaxID=43677 RepID=A0A8H9GFI0_9MICO|nr:sugar transferase [Promicromonospora citrea]NNH53566.1 sugar transferase [Promicromonospora citrea]GGM18811.1 polyprenyl glycosylphosphotransferase [Promicromonospora citrea]
MTIGNHVDREAAELTTPLDHRAARRAAPLTTPRRPTGVPWQDVVARRALLADLAAVVAAVALGYVLRFDREVQVDLVEPRGGQYVLISVALAEAWVVALGLAGARSPRILGSGREEYVRVARGTLALFGLAAVVCYLVKFDLARSYVAVTLPVGLALLLVGRRVLATRLHAERAQGRFRRRTLVVGARDAVLDLCRRVERAHEAGFVVVGVCLPGGAGVPSPVDGVPVLGRVEDAAEAARAIDADVVAVTASDSATPTTLKRLAWDLEVTGAELVVVPALADVASPRLLITPVDGVPVVQVSPPGYTGLQHAVKRVFDLVVATLLLLVVAVPLLVLGLCVRLTSPGPALFRQQRIGLNGAPFTLYKLRTMRQDAEADLADVLDGEVGVFYKPKADPRVTPLGRFLRTYSLDEFPQLVNVLRGDMSLVGPRPQVPLEVAQYDDALRRRLLVKPGLTGLWQVSGRNDLSIDQGTRLDLYYVENWSLLGDVGIMLRTAREIIAPSGAY